MISIVTVHKNTLDSFISTHSIGKGKRIEIETFERIACALFVYHGISKLVRSHDHSWFVHQIMRWMSIDSHKIQRQGTQRRLQRGQTFHCDEVTMSPYAVYWRRYISFSCSLFLFLLIFFGSSMRWSGKVDICVGGRWIEAIRLLSPFERPSPRHELAWYYNPTTSETRESTTWTRTDKDDNNRQSTVRTILSNRRDVALDYTEQRTGVSASDQLHRTLHRRLCTECDTLAHPCLQYSPKDARLHYTNSELKHLIIGFLDGQLSFGIECSRRLGETASASVLR